MLDNLLISLTKEEGAELELKILGAGVSLAPFIWPEPSGGWWPTWHFAPTLCHTFQSAGSLAPLKT